MKKNVLLFSMLGFFLAAMVSFATVSCSKDDDSSGGNLSNENIVGTWKYSAQDYTRTYRFKDDYTGTFSIYDHGDNIPGTFKYDVTSVDCGHLVYTSQFRNGTSYEYHVTDGKMYIDGREYIKQ